MLFVFLQVSRERNRRPEFAHHLFYLQNEIKNIKHLGVGLG